MELSVIFFVILALIVAIWCIFKFKGFHHKLMTIFLIALVLFSFFSFYLAFNGKGISIKNFSDLGDVARLYFSWLGSVFNNMKVLTGQAIKMDWQGNKTVS